MSVFTCKNNHIMNGYPKCPICGQDVYSMDGESNEMTKSDWDSFAEELEQALDKDLNQW
jgi:hypothetical protein